MIKKVLLFLFMILINFNIVSVENPIEILQQPGAVDYFIRNYGTVVKDLNRIFSQGYCKASKEHQKNVIAYCSKHLKDKSALLSETNSDNYPLVMCALVHKMFDHSQLNITNPKKITRRLKRAGYDIQITYGEALIEFYKWTIRSRLYLWSIGKDTSFNTYFMPNYAMCVPDIL